MTVPDELLEVGRVGRPHGIRGDLLLTLTTDRVERAAVGSRLLIAGEWYEVLQSSRSNERFRVHLSGVDTREAAQALTGQPMLAEPIDDPDAMWIHQLIGARVVEVSGVERGTCVAVVDNPAADLLELDGGALVPVTFVTDVTGKGAAGTITIDPPEGLFDLFEPGSDKE
jgi:16S rRNA processing protein RimM